MAIPRMCKRKPKEDRLWNDVYPDGAILGCCEIFSNLLGQTDNGELRFSEQPDGTVARERWATATSMQSLHAFTALTFFYYSYRELQKEASFLAITVAQGPPVPLDGFLEAEVDSAGASVSESTIIRKAQR